MTRHDLKTFREDIAPFYVAEIPGNVSEEEIREVLFLNMGYVLVEETQVTKTKNLICEISKKTGKDFSETTKVAMNIYPDSIENDYVSDLAILHIAFETTANLNSTLRTKTSSKKTAVYLHGNAEEYREAVASICAVRDIAFICVDSSSEEKEKWLAAIDHSNKIFGTDLKLMVWIYGLDISNDVSYDETPLVASGCIAQRMNEMMVDTELPLPRVSFYEETEIHASYTIGEIINELSLSDIWTGGSQTAFQLLFAGIAPASLVRLTSKDGEHIEVIIKSKYLPTVDGGSSEFTESEIAAVGYNPTERNETIIRTMVSWASSNHIGIADVVKKKICSFLGCDMDELSHIKTEKRPATFGWIPVETCDPPDLEPVQVTTQIKKNEPECGIRAYRANNGTWFYQNSHVPIRTEAVTAWRFLEMPYTGIEKNTDWKPWEEEKPPLGECVEITHLINGNYRSVNFAYCKRHADEYRWYFAENDAEVVGPVTAWKYNIRPFKPTDATETEIARLEKTVPGTKTDIVWNTGNPEKSGTYFCTCLNFYNNTRVIERLEYDSSKNMWKMAECFGLMVSSSIVLAWTELEPFMGEA